MKLALAFYCVLIITALLLIVSMGRAHENELWSHGTYVMNDKDGALNCGAGYVIAKDYDGAYQPYLLATHADQNNQPFWHKTQFTIEARDCDLMWDMLMMCASPNGDEEKGMCNAD
jgi:hypothetical protein